LVVLRVDCADADHVGAMNAMMRGLAKQDRAVYLVHTSGTGVLMVDDFIKQLPLGEGSNKVFNDWDGIKEVLALPDSAPRREVENIVLSIGEKYPQIKTAIVCPPTIYGVGRGAGNQRSIQVPILARGVLQIGEGFQVGHGKARWSNVHVHDLSSIYGRLIEEAVKGNAADSKSGVQKDIILRRMVRMFGVTCASTLPGPLFRKDGSSQTSSRSSKKKS
jgi:nucleoside-diphosphate-sugar epimerase